MKLRRMLGLFLATALVLSLLVGCTPAVDDEPPNGNGDELNKEEVLWTAAVDYMSNLPDKNNALSAADALQLLEDNPEQVMLVDIRGKDDYDAGHIAGAVNIPFAELGKNLDRLPKTKQIILQCYSGQSSSVAVALTRILGLNTLNFQGGMNFGWAPLELDEGTLETEENPLPDAVEPELDEKNQIIWDAVAAFFDEGKTYIEGTQDAYDLFEANPGTVYVLDIRGADDYAKGHIDTAENIPFKEVGANFDSLPKTQPIYVVCYTGQTAGQTLGAMRLAGLNAFSVSRGMTGWDGAELPVVE